ncbi:biotin--[acetyl-CoA-carboxylase] ligase [Aureimonas leprariae]|uniref:biotin--[biotin carboxyl-carrier protein] ligase n=2 Tax=Plantimonas leprariae TaxID=2615207 RepID=A0A7V7PS63_9HYPH|nr:biotin--[acetyl-CoA-carboxylase] ligase [Aureimonas leprariae]
MEAARAGDPGPLWITAARQTAGRGRRSRSWVSEPGNLFASVALIDPAPADALGNLPLVAALGVRNGLAALPYATKPAIAIKWPNDVLVSGRKAVGILIESERLPSGRMAVVVGIGVNVASCPSDTPYPVTSLAQEGCRADLAAVFGCVAEGLEAALSLWDRGRNFAAIRLAWLQYAAGLGAPCRVNLADRSIDGTFTDLDEAGRLVLKEPSGSVRTISAGDVFPLASADAASTYGHVAAQ